MLHLIDCGRKKTAAALTSALADSDRTREAAAIACARTCLFFLDLKPTLHLVREAIKQKRRQLAHLGGGCHCMCAHLPMFCV